MKLILKCHISYEDWDGCDYAFVDITPELAHLILRRKASREAMAESDWDVSEVHYHDGGPMYFTYQEDLEYLTEKSLGEGWIEVPELTEEQHVRIESVADRTECDRMVISRDGFHWECYPKHCDPVCRNPRGSLCRSVQGGDGGGSCIKL